MDTKTYLVARKTLVHRYAGMGFRPADVYEAADTFMDALGIAPFGTALYAARAVELQAFELYLNRQLAPEPLEQREMREAGLQQQTADTLEYWGTTADQVTKSLRLDTTYGLTFEIIARNIEDELASVLNAVAITVDMQTVTVDGVMVDLPHPVAAAIRSAARRAATRGAVQPF